jgi:hypothetical protein
MLVRHNFDATAADFTIVAVIDPRWRRRCGRLPSMRKEDRPGGLGRIDARIPAPPIDYRPDNGAIQDLDPSAAAADD